MQVVIVGNGVAGNSAAESILELDPKAKVTLVSEESVPEYSACALCDFIAGEIPERRLFLKEADDYRAMGIRAILGKRVHSFDPAGKTIAIGERMYPYDKLVLATGSRPVMPAVNGIDKRGVFCLKSIADAKDMARHHGRSVVVVGSGPIGIEATVALRKRGYDVHLVELLNSVLPKILDEKCSAVVTENLRGKGVNVALGEAVVEIGGGRNVEEVVTNRRRIPCDIVVLCIGMLPRTELLKGHEGVLGKNACIKVNASMESALPDVYACGDCVEFSRDDSGESVSSMLWPNAKQQGKVAGYNIAGGNRGYMGQMNTVSLRIFNACVSSVSHPRYVPDQRHERVEKETGNGLTTFVLQGGRIISIQAVGAAEDLGVFSPFVQRGDAFEKIRRHATSSLGRCSPSWVKRIDYYLSG